MNRLLPPVVDALQNPLKNGHVVTCWQNGQRILMHSEEVARLMAKPRSHISKRRHIQQAIQNRSSSDNKNEQNEELKRYTTMPQIVARSRAITENLSWQTLAKVMCQAAGHPSHCHQHSCRRNKKCNGGKDACYLREFEIVDVIMQKSVLPRLSRGMKAETAEL